MGPKAKGAIDLDQALELNLKAVAKALGKPLSRLTVITLAKPRHDKAIKEMQGLGVRVFAIPDGDVAASILTCLPDSEVDMLYGIGGAPEGVISAAVIRALDGDMQAAWCPVIRSRATARKCVRWASRKLPAARRLASM